MGFNPDEYLRKKQSQFSVDDYLKSKGLTPDVSKLESLARGAAQGASFGFSDEIVGGAEAAWDKLTGDQKQNFVDLYAKYRDESRTNNQAAQDANPYSYGAGELGAGLATAIIPGTTLAKGASLAAKAGMGAVQGGLAGLGMSKADNVQDMALDTALAGGLGAAVPVALDKAIIPAAKGVGNFVGKNFLPKLGRVANNIPEEYTREYLAREGKIEAPRMPEILDKLVKHYDDSSTNLDMAKTALQDSKMQVNNALQDAKFNARTMIEESKAALEKRVQAITEDLKSKNAGKLAPNVVEAVGVLKDIVKQGSSEAYEILGKQKEPINIAPLMKTLDDEMQGLTINGVAVSDTSEASLNSISKLSKKISMLGTDVTPAQAKKLLQDLDNDTRQAYSPNSGVFTPQADAIKVKVRSVLDGIVKDQFPEYRKKMIEVAENADLLSKLKPFGEEKTAIGRLNALSGQSGQMVDLPLLQNLEKKTNSQFSPVIEDYLRAKGLLNAPSKMNELISKTPEFLENQKILEAQKNILEPDFQRAVKANPDYLAKEAAFNKAKDDYSILRYLSPTQVESKVKAMTGQRNYGSNYLFDQIAEKTGIDYKPQIKDRAILDSFGKSDTNGSRKTLFGAIEGNAITGGSRAGSAIGAIAGFVGDRYSGPVFKKVLDGKISADQAIRSFQGKTGKYTAPLVEAAKRGNSSLAATMFLICQKDEEFRKQMMNDNQQ